MSEVQCRRSVRRCLARDRRERIMHTHATHGERAYSTDDYYEDATCTREGYVRIAIDRVLKPIGGVRLRAVAHMHARKARALVGDDLRGRVMQ